MSDVVVIKKQRGRSSWGNWCKNYRAMATHETCEAGIQFASVREEHDPIKYRRENETTIYTATQSNPCFLDFNFCGAECPSMEFPSDDEIKKHDEEMMQQFNRVGKARKAIVADITHRNISDGVICSGGILCPICSVGALSYTRAGYNGHIHASCSTKDCVAWME